MRKRDWAEGGIANRSIVELEHRVLAKWARALNAKSHEKVVGGVCVRQRPAKGGFTGLEQQRLAAIHNGPGSRLNMD